MREIYSILAIGLEGKNQFIISKNFYARSILEKEFSSLEEAEDFIKENRDFLLDNNLRFCKIEKLIVI